jgi:hypothetical protein
VVAAIVLLCGSSIIAPAQGDSLLKIGYLGFGAATPPTFFQKRMRELGYSEGKDVEVEYRFADGRPEKLPALARELVDAKVNVIVAIGDEAVVAAKNATRTIPKPSDTAPQKNSGPPTDAGETNFVRSTHAHRGLQCPELAQLRPQIVPWSSLCRADWVRNDPVLTTRG